MTKIKFCGLKNTADIEAVNALKPDYAGFVFAEFSRRYISPETACQLKRKLSSDIKAVGVFVDAPVDFMVGLADSDIIDVIQLHGHEDDGVIAQLRAQTDKTIIQAFRIQSSEDAVRAEKSPADYILLDAGAGEGRTFSWELVKKIRRPYFLAGGLNPENAGEAIEKLHPYALDVSSGIETDGGKDSVKMQVFKQAVYAQDAEENM